MDNKIVFGTKTVKCKINTRTILCLHITDSLRFVHNSTLISWLSQGHIINGWMVVFSEDQWPEYDYNGSTMEKNDLNPDYLAVIYLAMEMKLLPLVSVNIV